jgi:hypothetical protein
MFLSGEKYLLKRREESEVESPKTDFGESRLNRQYIEFLSPWIFLPV